MAINIGDIELHLSGGAANSDPTASLGGVISTHADTRIKSQTATTTISEYTILDAFGNPTGVGQLRWDDTAHAICWQPSGGSEVQQPITADGVYVVGNANGYIVIDTGSNYATLYGGGNKIDSNVNITNVLEEAWDNISAQQSLDGLVEYRCFFIINTHATLTANSVVVWIKEQPNGADSLEIALPIPLTKGNSPITLADEIDSTNQLVPGSNITTWASPSTQGTGLAVGNLAAGEYMALWQKRTVPADTYTKTLNDKSVLGISAII